MTRVLAIAFTAWILATRSAAADPTTAAEHFKQGKAFFEAKQYDQAILEYQAAFAIDSRAAHLFNIARAYQLSNNAKPALDYYQKFLAADPTSPNAKEARGYIVDLTRQVAEEDRKRKAEEDASAKALAEQQAKVDAERKRTAAEGHAKLAEAYARAGEWGQAGDEYREAAAATDDPRLLRTAGEAYAKQPDHAKARQAYLAYLAKVPRAADSDAIRDRIAAETQRIDEADRLAKLKQGPKHEPPPIEYDRVAQRARRSIGTKVIVAGSVVVGAGIVLGAIARKFTSDADAFCTSSGSCSPKGADTLHSARNFAHAADVAVPLGVVGIITGIAIWVNAPRPTPISNTLTITPTGNGVAITGSF